jgi:hypothetical protein
MEDGRGLFQAFLIGALISFMRLYLMTYHPSKTLSLNMVTLRIRISTCEFLGDINIQSIEFSNLDFLELYHCTLSFVRHFVLQAPDAFRKPEDREGSL